jgi:hypothetical protein
MNGVLHEEPDRSVFEGDVLKIEHDWGADYDVQAGGWSGQSSDTWLSEHVLARFAGKHVRVTIEVVAPTEAQAGHGQPQDAVRHGGAR